MEILTFLLFVWILCGWLTAEIFVRQQERAGNQITRGDNVALTLFFLIGGPWGLVSSLLGALVLSMRNNRK